MTRRRRCRVHVLRVLALGALAWSFVPVSANADASTLTPQAYELRLRAARAIAERGVEHPSPSRMVSVRGTLGMPVTVRLPSGPVTVPRDPLLEGLRGSTADDFRRAATHLSALEVAAAQARSVPTVDEARLRAQLTHALAGISRSPTLGRRILNAIAQFIGWLVEHLAHVRGAGSLVSWLVVAALVGALVMAVRWLGVGVVAERRVPQGAVPSAPLGAEEWRRLAESALGAGDRVAAIRCLYHAMATTLDARGVLTAGPGLTAGEFRFAVRSAGPHLAGPVDAATSVFERTVYALRDPGDDEVRAMIGAERAIRTT